MSPDDIDTAVLDLNDFLHDNMGIDLDDLEYDMLHTFMHNTLDKFCTRDRNYN